MSFEKGADDATHFDGQSQLWLMVNENQRDLWDRLERFQVDDPSKVAFPFVVRLARENGWSREFAQRVFDEYKRFAFLCMVSGHHCTPSDEVDQAWHLHLTYTRSYWEKFCPKVLRADLHHEPTKGGEDEDDKFEDWYRQTLESYRFFFSAEPPKDVWPDVETRFERCSTRILVDRRHAFIIPKRPLRKIASAAGLVALGLVTVGCAQQASSETILFLLIIAVFLVAGILALIWAFSDRKFRGNGGGCSAVCASGCSSSSGCGHSGCGSSGCGSAGCGGGCGGGGCGS